MRLVLIGIVSLLALPLQGAVAQDTEPYVPLSGAVSTPRLAAAQASQHDWGFWASAAIGPATPYEFGVTATAAVRYTRFLVRVRYASAFNFLGNFDDDVGVLVGIVLTPEPSRGQLAVGAGVGRVRGFRGSVLGGREIPATTGFLLDLEARLALTGFLGLTGYGFADFNSRESFGGIALGLYLGRL